METADSVYTFSIIEFTTYVASYKWTWTFILIISEVTAN